MRWSGAASGRQSQPAMGSLTCGLWTQLINLRRRRVDTTAEQQRAGRVHSRPQHGAGGRDGRARLPRCRCWCLQTLLSGAPTSTAAGTVYCVGDHCRAGLGPFPFEQTAEACLVNRVAGMRVSGCPGAPLVFSGSGVTTRRSRPFGADEGRPLIEWAAVARRQRFAEWPGQPPVPGHAPGRSGDEGAVADADVKDVAATCCMY